MNDREIYSKAARLLKAGQNVVLITVISTTGSTPGKVGYKMLLWGEDAQTLGTVGGGFIEAQIINIAKNLLSKSQTHLCLFNLDGAAQDPKPICGGSIELLLETFDKDSLPLFKDLSSAGNLANAALISFIAPPKPPRKILLKNIDRPDDLSSLNFSPEAVNSLKQIVAKQQTTKTTLPDGTQIFVETIPLHPMLFIFGAGHLACRISKCAASLNFRVTVWDDRPEFANKDRFPDAAQIIVDGFDNVLDKVDISDDSYIIIVTRGHTSDELILEQALKTNAKYIGMIGSRKKTSTILNNLKKRKVPPQTLSRVYSPIGISIGAVTPEEITLSIVAELVKTKRLGHAPKPDHMTIAPTKPQDQKQ
ncbi:MAG: XdhC family protein [Planctomycetota bacterium]|nr:MAG: XdhC family protein [Planctomycetota bacterium]